MLGNSVHQWVQGVSKSSGPGQGEGGGGIPWFELLEQAHFQLQRAPCSSWAKNFTRGLRGPATGRVASQATAVGASAKGHHSLLTAYNSGFGPCSASVLVSRRSGTGNAGTKPGERSSHGEPRLPAPRPAQAERCTNTTPGRLESSDPTVRSRDGRPGPGAVGCTKPVGHGCAGTRQVRFQTQRFWSTQRYCSRSIVRNMMWGRRALALVGTRL